jgi:hypothetical protein
MRNSGDWYELQRIIDEAADKFAQEAQRDPSLSRKDIEKYARQSLGARFAAMSPQNPDLALDVFVERVWAAIVAGRGIVDRNPEPEEPYSFPGIEPEE